MNFQEAQEIMLSGEEVIANGLNYKIKDDWLYFFRDGRWNNNLSSFDILNMKTWSEVPAKEYTFQEAAELCTGIDKSFTRINDKGTMVTLSYIELDGLSARSPDGKTTIDEADVLAMWTEVK